MKKILLFLLIFHFSLFTLSAQSWLWARQGRNASNKSFETGAASIAMDKYHNIYQTGKFDGDTLIFGSDTLFGQPYETFLVKYDENGNVLWAKLSQTNKNNSDQDVASNYVVTDSKGNAYITGEFEDTISFQSFSLADPTNYTHAFLVKYDVNGDVKWARQSQTPIPGYSATMGFSIAVDKSDNLYLTGRYQSSATFDSDTLKGTFNPNAFLVKYDTNGNVIWAKQGINGITGYSMGQSVITDNMGYVYVAGFFQDTITFDSYTLTNPSLYQFNSFVVKYDSNGNALWAKQPSVPNGTSVSYADALGKDNSGNIYVTGYFSDTVSFGPTMLTSPTYNASPIFWAKYDNNGNLKWAKQAYNLDSLAWEGWSITTDGKYNLYLTGSGGGGGTGKAKIAFDSDTLQSKIRHGSVWLKFDSSGTVLNSYISDGGGDPQVPTVVDSSGCYVYFGGSTLDTISIFGTDTVGTFFDTFRPFVARWSDGECNPLAVNTIAPLNPLVILCPNPNKGSFELEIRNDLPGIKYVEVYNVLGEKLYSNSFTNFNSPLLINIGNQPSGIYFYRITDLQNSLSTSDKFIIQ